MAGQTKRCVANFPVSGIPGYDSGCTKVKVGLRKGIVINGLFFDDEDTSW